MRTADQPCRPHWFIVVTSVHHGTRARIAREMAGVLEADVAAPDEVSSASLDEYGMVGVGSGDSYARMHQALFAWLRGLPDAPKPAKPAFVFSKSGLPGARSGSPAA